MKNIETLIADGGEITLGARAPFECTATAADGSNALAMLVRRDGETLTALLKRLDKAIVRLTRTEPSSTRSTTPPIKCGSFVKMGWPDAYLPLGYLSCFA